MRGYAVLALHDLFRGREQVTVSGGNVDALTELEEMGLVDEPQQGIYLPTVDGWRALLLPEDSADEGSYDGITPAPSKRAS